MYPRAPRRATVIFRTSVRRAPRRPPAKPTVRKINVRNFTLATRSTSRDINRQILLNLVREHQPISRADLARRMNIGRGRVTALVNELIDEGAVYEGETVDTTRGRKRSEERRVGKESRSG